jgi:hypothetical protein
MNIAFTKREEFLTNQFERNSLNLICQNEGTIKNCHTINDEFCHLGENSNLYPSN